MDSRPLSNSIGAVLDPIFSIRRRIRVAPGATVRVAFWTIAASSRAALLDGVDKHRDATAFARASMLAWTQAQVQLHHLGVTAGEAGLFQRLAGHVIYAAPALRPSSDTIVRGGGAQSGLWPQGVSGDLPIVLLRIADVENLDIVRELLQAHEYWRMKQLAVDLVILNERRSSYVQELQIAIETLVRASQSRPQPGAERQAGRVFVLRADLIPAETRTLLTSVARVVLPAQRGGLFEQLERIVEPLESARAAPKRVVARLQPPLRPRPPDLEFFNGLGGFARDGAEYVTILGPGQSTPAPWINVIANPAFGFQTGTEGGGYTWSVNSRENQITPWSNDPVSDRSGEAFYLRDDDTGDLWGPTALPIRDAAATYTARHGRGYSRFEHVAHEIASDLLQYVPVDASIKISRLVLTNRSSRPRRLSVTAYVEWVLGPSRSASLAFVSTEIDAVTGAIFARNPWNMGFGSRVAFADLRGAQSDWTGDRREFIGRNGALADPAALAGAAPLSKKVGAGLDPCAAMRTKIELPPNGSVEVVFFLGEAASADEARESDRALSRRRSRRRRSRGRAQMGRHSRRGRRQDAGSLDGRHAQRLAHLPDAELPHLGALRLLPGERRLWFPRSIAGRHGARRLAASADARASAARRGAAVRRRRCSALVAAAFRPGRAHPHLRRSPVVGLCGRPLRRRHRGRRRPRRDGPVPGRPGAGAGRARQLLRSCRLRPDCDIVRALRARPRRQPRARRPWASLDGNRRLERRHEPRRRKGRRRKRLARLVPACGADRFHSARSGAPGDEARREMGRACRRVAGLARARGVGRRLVSASLFRRRRAARARRRARNAASIRSRNPGPRSRARRRPNGRCKRWARSNAN